eukprot:CAMPEP_0198151302 /NCGR_PEP_ID=MMETSP1443-20131203/55131_1 /TAXON_ID=186043 /ORGANISM="Entomoneis sp., Strain CCMP2396" /LENGTH=233 /DNA_ID=CAMNT_0043816927 /DNA_START=62 /DNA_END=763 /DNA_ORIENTATION=+
MDVNPAQEAQSINEFAATLIDDGYSEEAADELIHLASKLSGLVLLPSTGGTIGKAHQGMNDVYSTEEQRYNDSPLNEGERDITDFYSHPFVYHYPDALLETRDPMISSEQYNTAAVICLFNLGLCCQLEWDENRAKAELLHRALGYYQEAMSMLFSKVCCFLPQGPVVKVLLAICVNATHCQVELMQFDRIDYWENISCGLLKVCSQEVLQSLEFSTLRVLFNRSVPTNAPAA